VRGADLMDGTPIYDIKPYLPYTDSHPDADSGFSGNVPSARLTVVVPDALRCALPEKTWQILTSLLALDPRPRYQNDPTRVYGMKFQGLDIKFSVAEDVLTVAAVL